MALPPGRMGPPGVGETLAFVRNPYRFLEDHRRRYGDVFRSNVVGRKVVFLSGLEGAEAFFADGNISREDAHPFLMVDMFGGTNFEMYDGPKHFALKSIALGAFDHDAIGGYVGDMQRLTESTLERLSRAGDFRATQELRRLAIEAICWNVMGLEPGPETETMTREYATLLTGLTTPVPLRVPGMPYARAMAARDRLLARIRSIVEERRVRPGNDGLSRMLSATAADGRSYTDDEAVLEVHHIVVAGFIVYVLMAEVLRRLAQEPELRERCSDEVAAVAPDAVLSIDALDALRTSLDVVLEAKRLVPLVPLAFGRAARDFTCRGFDVPKDWTVYLALHLNNHDPTVYARPYEFDPRRFEPPREEHRKHPMAFIPQGAEPPMGHRCLGLDYSTYLTLVFLAVLVRGYEWELPPQRLEYDWRKRPPEPKDGLQVRLRAR